MPFFSQHNNYSWVVDEKEKARSSRKKKKKKLVLLIAWCSRDVTGIHSRYIFHSKELNRITSRKLSWNYIICVCSDAIIYSWKIRDELRNYSTEFINDKNNLWSWSETRKKRKIHVSLHICTFIYAMRSDQQNICNCICNTYNSIVYVRHTTTPLQYGGYGEDEVSYMMRCRC